jgi:hypothetical protein
LEKNDFDQFCNAPLPINWQFRFIHNQLFKTFVFPSRFCPGPFHSTIVRKADFRSDEVSFFLVTSRNVMLCYVAFYSMIDAYPELNYHLFSLTTETASKIVF